MNSSTNRGIPGNSRAPQAEFMQNQLLEPEVLSFVARGSLGEQRTHFVVGKDLKKSCLKVGDVGDWMQWNIMNVMWLKHPQISM